MSATQTELSRVAEEIARKRVAIGGLFADAATATGAERERLAASIKSANQELGKLVDTPNAIIDLRARGRVTVRIALPTTPANATQS